MGGGGKAVLYVFGSVTWRDWPSSLPFALATVLGSETLSLMVLLSCCCLFSFCVKQTEVKKKKKSRSQINLLGGLWSTRITCKQEATQPPCVIHKEPGRNSVICVLQTTGHQAAVECCFIFLGTLSPERQPSYWKFCHEKRTKGWFHIPKYRKKEECRDPEFVEWEKKSPVLF